MRRQVAIALGLVVLLAATASPAGADSASPIKGASTSTTTCHYQWKWKKYFKKVKRHGKVKKVARYRKVRRKICVETDPPAPSRIGIKSFEFHFVLSAKSLLSGDTIAELSNQGEDPHDLHISRYDGSDEVALPETLPGEISRARFETSPGTYRLWCSLPFHAERGMDTTFEVKPDATPPA